MRQKVEERVENKIASEPECHHHWIIEVANGPTSFGVCKICGERKEFLNAFPDFNPLKRRGNPMTLPVMPDVEVDSGSKS